MRLWLSGLAEKLRSSLFFVPMVAVVAAIILGIGSLAIDQRVSITAAGRLPLGLTSTVDSARAVLSTVAGATISFAGIAFSISLLIIQLASSQYSPRVIHTLFRDPFNKRVMALVVGTFTFCVIVLRSVRGPFEEGGDPIVPHLSVGVAVLLGIATILATVAFINHSAHTMDVSEILERVQSEALEQIEREWIPIGDEGSDEEGTDYEVRGHESSTETGQWEITEPNVQVQFGVSGWVQLIDVEAILDCLPKDTLADVRTFPGRYAIEGTPICAISPPPSDLDHVQKEIRSATAIGSTRTMQQDPSYGVRQLVDVGLKALSPSVNDPTTAQYVIFHCAAVLAEILRRRPRSRRRLGANGQRLLLSQQPTHEELIDLAFDELRIAAAAQPTVCVYLLEVIELLVGIARANEPPSETDDVRVESLETQARLVVAGCAAAGLLPHDLELVHLAYDKRFKDR